MSRFFFLSLSNERKKERKEKKKRKEKKTQKNILFYLPAVKADALYPSPRRQQHGTSGRLIHSTGLHPDEAGLYDIDAADPVVSRHFVQLGEQRSGGKSSAVERDGVSIPEADLEVCGLVGGGLGRDRAGEHGLGGLDPGVLESIS